MEFLGFGSLLSYPMVLHFCIRPVFHLLAFQH